MHSFLSALVLSFCFYDFPAGMNCKLESWAKWNLPPLSYFLSEDLITVTGMTLESPPRVPPCAPPCHSCIPELYLAFKPFARTCPSKASPPSYWLDVLGISQSGFPWLPHVVPCPGPPSVTVIIFSYAHLCPCWQRFDWFCSQLGPRIWDGTWLERRVSEFT